MSFPNHGFGSAAPAYAYGTGAAASSTPTGQPAPSPAPAPGPAPGSAGSTTSGGGGGFSGFDRLASLATAALTYCQVTSPARPAASQQREQETHAEAQQEAPVRPQFSPPAPAPMHTGPTVLDASAASAPLYTPPSNELYNHNPKAWADAYGYRVTKRKYTKRSEYWDGMGQSPDAADTGKAKSKSPAKPKSPAKAKKGGASGGGKKARKDEEDDAEDAKPPAKKKAATKRSAGTKRGAAASSPGDDAAIRRGKTRGQVRTRAPSKKMQEAMGHDSDDEVAENAKGKRPAAKSAAKKTAKKATKKPYADAVADAAAAADAALAGSPVAPTTTTKSGRKTKKKAPADGTPGKRKYVKKASWWGNRSGVNSPTAISRAKKEAEAIEAAKKAGKPLPVKQEPKPRRKYTKKSDYWKTNWDKKDGDGKVKKDGASEPALAASAGKGRGSSAGTRKAPKKEAAKTAPKSTGISKPAAKKEPAPTDEDSDSDESSVDLEAIVCCVCRCAVDYSDPNAFLPAPWVLKDKAEDEANKSDSSDSEGDESDEEEDSKKSGGKKAKSTAKGAESKKDQKKSDEEDENSDDEEQYHPPLPHNLHDPNNGLLLCDGVGCNRAYHQRCHFVPVLSIPRGDWHCLICRVKEDMLGTSPTKAGRSASKKRSSAKKQAKRRSSWDASAISSAVSSDVGSDDDAAPAGLDLEAVQKALTVSELDALYRVDPPPRPKKGEDGGKKTEAAEAGGAVKQEAEATVDDEVESSRQKQLQESFELVSAPLKARVLHTELTTKVKSIIDQSLSRIRQSENVIRAYTETSRARKSILDRYAMDGQVAQELVQALGKMAMAKQRIRGTLRSLEYIIKTNRSWEVDWLIDWIAKEEQRGLTAEPAESAGLDSATGLENPGDIRALIFAKGLEKRRIEPRFESGSNEAILSVHGAATSEKAADHPPEAIATKTSDEEDELSIDHLTCFQCHLSTSSDDNDLLLCDGAGCFRAVHQKCVHPHVGEEDLHEDVDWFCPFCSALGEWVHYAQVEYLGDDYVDYQREKARRAKEKAKQDRERRRNTDGDDADDEKSEEGDDSLASWEHPADVFPEADEEERVAIRLRDGGKRNERTDRWLCELLGIPYGDDDGPQAMAQGDIEDDYDEEDDSDVTSVNSDDESDDEGDDDDEDAASTISKSELNALSDYSSSDESSSDGDGEEEDGEKKDKRFGVRASKRIRRNQERGQVVPTGRQAKQGAQPNTALAALLRRSGYSGSGIGTGTGSESSSESEEEDKPDVGTLDESNIIAGKRQRTKVDYRKLNDAMFGSVDEDEAAKMFGKEEDEYNWAKEMSKKSRKRRSSSSSSSSSDSSDDDSSSDEDSSDDDGAGADDGKAKGDDEKKAFARKPKSSKTSKPKAKATPQKKEEDGPKRVSSRTTKGKKKPPPSPARSSAKKSNKIDPKTGEPVKKKRKYTKRAGGYWSNRSGENSPTAKSMAKKAAAALAGVKKGGASTPASSDSSSPKKKRKATPASKRSDSNAAGSTSASKKRKYTKKSASK